MGTRGAMEGKGPDGLGWKQKTPGKRGFFAWTPVEAGELERCSQKPIQSS